jgi:UrcA family protein
MNRNKYLMGGAAAAVLAAAVMAPCYAGSKSSLSIPTVQVEASSFKIESAPPWQSADRVELSAQVKAADLNLAHSRDVAILQRRVENAAQLVCKQIGERYPWLVDSSDQADKAACVRGAVDNAMTQIKVVALAQPMHANTGESRSG